MSPDSSLELPLSPPRLGIKILIPGFLLSLAVLALSEFYLDAKRQSILTSEVENTRRINTLLVAQTARIYDSVDILLRATIASLGSGQGLADQSELTLHQRFNSYITGMPHIRALTVLDAAGSTVATTFTYPTRHPNFSHREYYQALHDNPDAGLYIDVPTPRKNQPEQWILNVARRITNSKGEFEGIAVVSLVPDYFTSFYQSLELGEGSYVSLLREDSTLLMRYPAANDSIGKVFGRNPAIQPFLQQRLAHTSLQMKSYISNSHVLLNCGFANNHPLYICTSSQQKTLLKEWRRDRITIGAAALLISLLIMGLFIVLARQFNKRELITHELAQKNIHLDRLSKTDFLTGVANRHFIEATITALISKADRYQRPFSVILLDIDHFKEINDNHGHATGDRVLKQLSQLLSARIRVTDTIARWGGEEFLIVCDESDQTGTEALAETLRAALAAQNFGLTEPVTASFGATQFQTGESAKELFIRVDKQLYRAKNSGRNTVISN